MPTPGSVMPAVAVVVVAVAAAVGETRAKASSRRECICWRASSMLGWGGRYGGGGGAWPGGGELGDRKTSSDGEGSRGSGAWSGSD